MQAPQSGSALPTYFRFAVLAGTFILVVYSVLIVLNLTGAR